MLKATHWSTPVCTGGKCTVLFILFVYIYVIVLIYSWIKITHKDSIVLLGGTQFICEDDLNSGACSECLKINLRRKILFINKVFENIQRPRKIFEASTLTPKYSVRQTQEKIYPWKELSLAEIESNVVAYTRVKPRTQNSTRQLTRVLRTVRSALITKVNI